VGAFHAFMCRKHALIAVGEESVRKMMAGHRRLPQNWRETLDKPLTVEKMRRALRKRGGDKAPGRDGIGLTFFTATLESIQGDIMDVFTQMFVGGTPTDQQKGGIVCIPKIARHTQPILQAHKPLEQWLQNPDTNCSGTLTTRAGGAAASESIL
jgi:hypothetical protein